MVKTMCLPFEEQIEGSIEKTRDQVLMPIAQQVKNIVYPTILFASPKKSASYQCRERGQAARTNVAPESTIAQLKTRSVKLEMRAKSS